MFYTDLFDDPGKEVSLRTHVSNGEFARLDLGALAVIPGSPLCLHAAPSVLGQWHRDRTLDPHSAVVATGNHTFDDFRFLRLHYEVVRSTSESQWVTYDKGGEYQPFYSPATLVINWANGGAEVRAINVQRHGSDAQVMQSSRYWRRAGLCYTHVSSVGFSPRLLPEDSIFSSESISIFPVEKTECQFNSDDKLVMLLAFLASTAAQELVWVFGRYRKIENRAVSGLPISFKRLAQQREELMELGRRGVVLCRELSELDESLPVFCAPDAIRDRGLAGDARRNIDSELRALLEKLDRVVERLIDVPPEELTAPPRASLVDRFVARTAGTDAERAADLLCGLWASHSDDGQPGHGFARTERGPSTVHGLSPM